MKSLPVILNFLKNPQRRRSLLVLARLVGMFALLVLVFAVAFRYIMAWAGSRPR